MVLVACGVLAPQLALAAFPALTELEWQRVMAGERVAHKQSRELDGMTLFGGTAWQRVDAPADVVWDVVSRPDQYLHLLPFAVEVNQLSESEVLLRHRVAVGEVRYQLRFSHDPSRRVLKFSVPAGSGGDVRAGFGELQVRALDARTCVVAWTVFAKPDLGIVGGLFRGLVQRTMLEVPTRIKRYIARQRAAHAPSQVALARD